MRRIHGQNIELHVTVRHNVTYYLFRCRLNFTLSSLERIFVYNVLKCVNKTKSGGGLFLSRPNVYAYISFGGGGGVYSYNKAGWTARRRCKFPYNKSIMERLCTLNTATLSTRTHLAPKPAQTTWITFRGHSRSRILGSLKSWRGTVYY